MNKKKILFIENRYKTIFWEKLAKELSRKGYSIYWLVQNLSFIPIAENVYTIPYPTKKNYQKNKDINLSFVKSTDRIITYFKGTDGHYQFYYEKIEEIISKISPDLVVGESTLFHELLTIQICKKKNILYLHPTSIGYPPGRFSFYKYDTKTPYKGSMQKWEDAKCNKLIEDINHRKTVPDYIKTNKNKKNKIINKILDKTKIFTSYLSGEKYNTPSPLLKIKKDLETKIILKEWDKIAVHISDDIKFKKIILYPLQMQPEANLDVWGNKFKNQAKLIEVISKTIPENWYIFVKTNPKAKYEMNQELLNTVRKNKNIIPLHSATEMKEIFEKSSLVVTVTGTIAIECLLNEKPVMILGPSIALKFNGCVGTSNPKDINKLISQIEKKQFTHLDKAEKINFINTLVSTSYEGKISDPYTDPTSISDKNIRLVSKAICEIMEKR